MPRRLAGLFVTGAALITACSSTTSRDASTSAATAVTSTSGAATTSTTGSGVVSSTTAVTIPVTTAPTPTAPPTTASPTTAPPPTAAPTAPPTTAAPGPKMTSATFSDPGACSAPDATFQAPPKFVTVQWSATNADSVYVAIDNADGPFVTNLALTGSYDLPFGCPGPHTYYVVAVKGSAKDVKSKTFNG